MYYVVVANFIVAAAVVAVVIDIVDILIGFLLCRKAKAFLLLVR